MALGCVLVACSSAHERPAPPAPAAQVRVTPAPWTAGERVALQRDLGRVFADPILASAGLVALAENGQPLFARNASVPMTPASSLKVVVAATALGTLGPGRRLATTFVALGVPREGTLDGPLFMVGGGDPVLRSHDLAGGVGVLARAGIRRIAGDVVVDATAFSGPEQNETWDPADLGQDYAAGTSAISLDWDVAQFHITPAAVGEPASIEIGRAHV